VSVIWVRARCTCDECGITFEVAIDAASKAAESVFDMVEEALRGGEQLDGVGMCSNYEGVQRCGACSEAYVSEWIAGHPNHIAGAKVVSWYSRDKPAKFEIETYDGRTFQIEARLVQGLDLIDKQLVGGFGFMP